MKQEDKTSKEENYQKSIQQKCYINRMMENLKENI